MSVESEIIWLRVLLQIHREQEVLQAGPADFDAWYRAHIEQAHAAYMQHTSKHLVCDWRLAGASSAKEIYQFFNSFDKGRACDRLLNSTATGSSASWLPSARP